MSRRFLWLFGLLLLPTAIPAGADMAVRPQSRAHLKDLYFGEALYHAYQGEWFDAIARLDTELGQYHGLDEPDRDTLFSHIGDAEFSVGDFELYYRMHQRAGRAMKAVIEGNVDQIVRNEAAYRLAKIYFQKDQPANALDAIERIKGKVPDAIRDDVPFLRAQILIANGRFADAINILEDLQGVKSLEGFSQYNLGVALIKDGKLRQGYNQLDKAGQLKSNSPTVQALKDKSNLVLGTTLFEHKRAELAKQYLDRVRLKGPFSSRALLASGWSAASLNKYERSVVPWTLLVKRNIADKSVQEGMLALPYAYAQLKVFGKAALLYGKALEAFDRELEKLDKSIKSIREGKFLQALVREELKQDKNWVVKLRELEDTPETFYLTDLMASNDFQESLKNYLDLEELRQKMSFWENSLDSYEEIIRVREAYYKPLLPDIDKQFRVLDSQFRLRNEQRDRLDSRINAMLVAPRPDFLATADERILLESINRLETKIKAGKKQNPQAVAEAQARINRLKGVLQFRINTDYDQRLTDAYKNLRQLDGVIADARTQYRSFVRERQAATQSYEGYGDTILRLRTRLADAEEQVKTLMARQGHMLEVMAVNELTQRQTRLQEYQVKARFALADSYDRAVKAQNGEPEKEKEKPEATEKAKEAGSK